MTKHAGLSKCSMHGKSSCSIILSEIVAVALRFHGAALRDSVWILTPGRSTGEEGSDGRVTSLPSIPDSDKRKTDGI